MKARLFALIALAFPVAAVAAPQQPNQAPNQDANAPTAGQQDQRPRGGRGWGGSGMMGEGRGVMGTVTAVAADRFTVKNEAGESWTVLYSVNTRMTRMPPRPAGSDGQSRGSEGRERGMAGGSNPPTPIKPTDIKVGDAIMAGGEVDQAAKSVGAVMVMQLDPESARRMAEMRANYGKTWLMGKVTAINETSVTLQSGIDNASHTFAADENTTFRRRREPITLADIQIGDNVRVEGAIKNGQFLAASVSVMMPQANGGPARRSGPQPQ